MSEYISYSQVNPLTRPRVKEKLRSGEMMVSGDQWPIFLYHGYAYDPEDPWNGIFRSAILVSVRLSDLFDVLNQD